MYTFAEVARSVSSVRRDRRGPLKGRRVKDHPLSLPIADIRRRLTMILVLLIIGFALEVLKGLR